MRSVLSQFRRFLSALPQVVQIVRAVVVDVRPARTVGRAPFWWWMLCTQSGARQRPAIHAGRKEAEDIEMPTPCHVVVSSVWCSEASPVDRVSLGGVFARSAAHVAAATKVHRPRLWLVLKRRFVGPECWYCCWLGGRLGAAVVVILQSGRAPRACVGTCV